MVNPELWVAAQLRKRAEAMAWTPGFVLDYARALKAATRPTPLGWYTLIASIKRFWRYARMIRRGEPMSAAALEDKAGAQAARKRSIE
jgi:hypothetical protein